MSDTTLLVLPLLDAAQAQKHVTVNEGLLRLDALVALSVIDRDLAAPPGSPSDSDRYIVAAGATGAWSGEDGNIAAYQDGAWNFYWPREGWLAWVADEARFLVYRSGAWREDVDAIAAAQTKVAMHSYGASTSFRILAEEHTLAAAATSDTTIEIPAGAILAGVTLSVSQAITGATSFDAGIASATQKFGAGIAAALGTSRIASIDPEAFAAATKIRFTAVGGNFSSGKIKTAIHVLELSAPA